MSASPSASGAPPAALARSLKNRHIQMIALGGAIGTGLLTARPPPSGWSAPASSCPYLIGGLAIYLILRFLGEMSTQEPVSGAFSHFAYRYWGGFAGFLSGWNYWLLYILVQHGRALGGGHLRELLAAGLPGPGPAR